MNGGVPVRFFCVCSVFPQCGSMAVSVPSSGETGDASVADGGQPARRQCLLQPTCLLEAVVTE